MYSLKWMFTLELGGGDPGGKRLLSVSLLPYKEVLENLSLGNCDFQHHFQVMNPLFNSARLQKSIAQE